MGERSIYFYILLLLLGLGVLQGLLAGIVFLLRRRGGRIANVCYGLLLTTFSLTLLHNIFVLLDWDAYLSWPLYFTLSFPALLFYYVKFNLYPRYRFRLTDSKHFVLPIGQFVFFMYVFSNPVIAEGGLQRHFYNPFYGAMEQLLYLSTFFFYLYSARKYIQFKSSHYRKEEELRVVSYMKMLVYTFSLLFVVHTIFVITDFISYEFFQVNLRSLKLFAGLGAFSFAALIFWLGIYGTQVLIWGKQAFEQE